jgi:hypothetical protein
MRAERPLQEVAKLPGGYFFAVRHFFDQKWDCWLYM